MIFEAVKDAVTVPEAAREYGFIPNRASFICCPFHSEKTASLKLYERGFYCYGCGAHGSVIDFVMQLFSLDPLEAVKRINADFNLKLDLDRPPDPDQLERLQRIRNTREQFEEWKLSTLNMLTAAIRTANQADFNKLSKEEMVAVRFKETMEYWSSVLESESLDEQMIIFRDREEIRKLCKTILKNTLTKSAAA